MAAIDALISNSNSPQAPTTNTDVSPVSPTGGSAIDKLISSSGGDIQKINKQSNINTNVISSQEEAQKASSPWGMIKNTITGIPRSLYETTLKPIIEPIIEPSQKQKELESTMFPKTGNKFLDTIEAPARAVGKITSRLVMPGLEGTGESIGVSLKINDLFNKAKQSGKAEDYQKVADYAQAHKDVLDKKFLQVLGDSAQSVMTFAAPELGGEMLDKASTMGIKGALSSGLLKGSAGGLTFGVAQVLSSGTKDPVQIAKTLLQMGSAGGILGLITSGSIPVSKELLGKAKEVLPEYNKLVQEHSANLDTIGEEATHNKLQAEQGLTPTESANMIEGVKNEKIAQARANPDQAIKEVIQKHVPEQTKHEKTSLSLENEAKKYKSAEEFMNKQPTYYHTTKSENVSSIESKGFSGEIGKMSQSSGGKMQDGVFLYPEKSSANAFGKNFKNPSVVEVKVSGKVYDANTNTKYGWEDNLQTQEIAKDPKVIAQLKKDGYVGVKSTELGTDAVFIFDSSAIKTKSQLEDIWNKANKTEKQPIEVPRETTPEGMKVTKSANVINEKLVNEGISKLPIEEQSQYKTGSYKKDLENTIKLMTNDFEQAKNIALGNEPVPKDIRYPQVLYNAIEAHAIKIGDTQLLIDLAKSPLGTRLSEAAGELGSHGFNDNPTSPVQQIQKVQKNRAEVFEKKTGTKVKEQTKIIKEGIKKQISKNAPTKQSWTDFIKSIEC